MVVVVLTGDVFVADVLVDKTLEVALAGRGLGAAGRAAVAEVAVLLEARVDGKTLGLAEVKVEVVFGAALKKNTIGKVMHIEEILMY